jgi:hypothetical protein
VNISQKRESLGDVKRAEKIPGKARLPAILRPSWLPEKVSQNSKKDFLTPDFSATIKELNVSNL